MGIDREALRAWVEQSCAVQGVAVFVADPSIVARVGSLLGSGGPAVAPTGASRDPEVTGSKRARFGLGRIDLPGLAG